MRAMRIQAPALVGGLLVAFVVPATAHAATKTVDMGLPLKDQNTFNQKYGSDVNDFFPHRTTIHVGDSIKYGPTSFHTVELPRKDGSALALFATTTQTIAGAVDAAGAPFWFNGQPKVGFNPLLLASKFGKRVAYTGAKRVDTGAPLSEKAKPVFVRFSKTGSYTFFCDIHAGMRGSVLHSSGSPLMCIRITPGLCSITTSDIAVSHRMALTSLTISTPASIAAK